MVAIALILIAVGFAVALPTTAIMRSLGHRIKALDGAGVAGQVKAAVRPVPNTGGLGIYLAVVLPMIAGILAITLGLADRAVAMFPELARHLPGIMSKSTDAIALIAGLSVLHIVGVIDDRKPLGPFLKLAIMLAVTSAVVVITDSRLLTLLDSKVGIPWASLVVAVLWIAVITNAMNFLDNMDGLTGGVAAIAGSFFLAAAILHGQWFIAATLALLVGGCLGFLIFNFPAPKASIFMGDGGSLVIGFLLGFLTVRTTFYDASAASPDVSGGWYGVFMPLIVLAVPLYDFCSVTIIRLRAGRSPFVGDLNHLSHRLVRRGLSKRDAVLCIYGLTAITAVSAIPLGSLQPWQAKLVGLQTVLVLLVLALFEGRAGDRPQDVAK